MRKEAKDKRSEY